MDGEHILRRFPIATLPLDEICEGLIYWVLLVNNNQPKDFQYQKVFQHVLW